eukprot:2497462-Prymnesium_polylepis.2
MQVLVKNENKTRAVRRVAASPTPAAAAAAVSKRKAPASTDDDQHKAPKKAICGHQSLGRTSK